MQLKRVLEVFQVECRADGGSNVISNMNTEQAEQSHGSQSSVGVGMRDERHECVGAATAAYIGCYNPWNITENVSKHQIH